MRSLLFSTLWCAEGKCLCVFHSKRNVLHIFAVCTKAHLWLLILPHPLVMYLACYCICTPFSLDGLVLLDAI